MCYCSTQNTERCSPKIGFSSGIEGYTPVDNYTYSKRSCSSSAMFSRMLIANCTLFDFFDLEACVHKFVCHDRIFDTSSYPCGYCMNRITICAVSNGRPSNRPKIVSFTLATAVSAKWCRLQNLDLTLPVLCRQTKCMCQLHLKFH